MNLLTVLRSTPLSELLVAGLELEPERRIPWAELGEELEKVVEAELRVQAWHDLTEDPDPLAVL
jgi:hypothetical protein